MNSESCHPTAHAPKFMPSILNDRTKCVGPEKIHSVKLTYMIYSTPKKWVAQENDLLSFREFAYFQERTVGFREGEASQGW